MNGKYVEYFLFIRDTFLVLNTLNNPQERQYILNRLTMERVDIFSPFLLLSCLLLCKISPEGIFEYRKCRENVLHRYLETEYYETGYLYFLRVMKISVKS